MNHTGTLKIWIAINTLNNRPSYKTIETVYDCDENTARLAFKAWQDLNPHMPHACAKWVPDAVILR